ncbi:Polygalacturonase [Filimonas lacunae]|uniref:Polygalacturonase n=1 Tax=Filimonas lacunae TaxID=477680 RepID=A0A173MJB6_9BACT|nr:glycoside hydrolase family 28 protein [Filimonas lacunae]BAV07569.1 polygalacturonase [Filimonas lacunae]SIT29924.1 Polygalacturonase [Filimonas lacunae]
MFQTKTTRLLLGGSLFLAAAFALTSLTIDKPRIWASPAQAQQEMEQLRKLIPPPVFKNRDYNILEYGAKGDGVTNNSIAIKNAIEACNKGGGGRVIVPAGNYLTGPVYLKSNTDFHLESGARIVFSQDTKDYPLVLTRWEGMDCINYSPQFYAYEEENIAITGSGTIDGNASNEHWWSWKGKKQYGWKEGMPNQLKARDSLHLLMHAGTDPRKRIFGDGYYLRPYMFAPYNCRNVMLQGVTMLNSPMWFISPVMCDNVTIEKVHVQADGPNTDGCDPDACWNVLIKDCFFDTGDDCIAIKSGRDEDGRKFGRPALNHIIEGCQMKDGHGGITIGSEIAGGAKNIYAMNCKMSSHNLNIALRFKTSSSRGGIIENIFFKDIEVGSYKDAALSFDMFYEQPGNYVPTIRNILIDNLNVANGGQYGINIHAYKESPVQYLQLFNSTIKGVKTPMKADHVKDLNFTNVRINDSLFTSPATQDNN